MEPTGDECVDKYHPGEIWPGEMSAFFNEPRDKIEVFLPPKKTYSEKKFKKKTQFIQTAKTP